MDGTVSETGEWTLWAKPEKTFKSPGLNCSGFLLAASRFLLGRDFTIDMAKNDFFGDSGKGSPWGEDWDFGLDVALNLAGRDSPTVPPVGGHTAVSDPNGRPMGLGADIHGDGLLEALAALKPGALYFFAISKPDRRFPVGVSYYHNGIMLPDGGRAMLYHSTKRVGVHRLDLMNPNSLATFRKSFPPIKGKGERRILFVEARPFPCPSPPIGPPPPPSATPGPAAPGGAALPR
ncbi:MAG: hypothetical protein LBF40_02000 [Deltaproteobacteria bacterium]|nr:hypothetical protein [Deltaproteobacteria bacterium]